MSDDLLHFGGQTTEMAHMVQGSTESPFEPLDEDQLRAVVANELKDCVGGGIQTGSDIAQSRREALRLFYGKPFGNEQPGRSAVVMTDVSDTIHWMMPSLMKMFFGGPKVFEFEATKKEDEAWVKQATAVINQIYMEDSDGFEEAYEWIFTGLLEKRSYMRVEQDEKIEPRITTYKGLTQAEFEALMEEEEGRSEVVAFDERTITYKGQQIPIVDVTMRQVEITSRLRCRGIPPEEFVVARREKKINDDTWFCGERRRISSSELISMGFDENKVAELPVDDDMEFSQVRIERLHDEQDFPASTNTRTDLASRMHWVNDCFIRVDADGDGYSELRNVMVVGDEATVLLENEYANFVPFASIAPIPIPYKLHGLSVADLVGDLQKIKSTLMRQILDNTYLQNNQRHVIIEGAVQVADLLTSRPGGVIRATMPGAVEPLQVTPLSPLVMELISYLDHEREVRTGVSAERQGMDAGVLKSSATGVSASLAAAQARIELIARIIAETGMKQLGHLLLRTFKQNNNKPVTMCVQGEWIDVDPSQWNDKVRVKVNVGIGVGAAAERISFLMGMIQLQKEAIAMGAADMVTPRHVYEAVSRLSESMGFPRGDLFFAEPKDGATWPQPKPTPDEIEANAKATAEQRLAAEAQIRGELERMKLEVESANNEGMLAWRNRSLDMEDKWKKMAEETKVKIAEMTAARSNSGGDS